MLKFITIYKSKLLPFTNVFVVGVYSGRLSSGRVLPVRAINLVECQSKGKSLTTIEKERRLMYLAVTRNK